MKRNALYSSLVITVLLVSSALAQDKAKKIDDLLKTYAEYGQLNGSVLVAEKGKVIYKKGFGMANMEWDIPNQPDTKFRIGSVTKQFTAAVILQLAAEGKIKLDGHLIDYLPDYRKDTGSRVTIHQLLNHTSGIPSYTDAPTFFADDSRDPYSVADFIKKFASGDLEFEPGSKFRYNNSAYFLLGAIIEKITGKPYADVMKERIFDPLGMIDSGYDDFSPLIRRRATGYQRNEVGKFTNAPYLDMKLPYAAGSLYSTVEDLYKWDQALYQDKILSADSQKLMYTPSLGKYGYGFFIDQASIGPDRKANLVLHSGGINGFNSLITRDVDQRNLVVILDNVGLGRYHNTITRSILNILYDQPYDVAKRSIAETLLPVAMERGSVAAVAEYRKLKAASPSIYDFAESELNTMGYQLLSAGKTKDAIEIFKLNTQMFPAGYNTYDSLGEAYLKDGQKDLALANYKKSVELNPGSANGLSVIQQMEGKSVKVDNKILDAYAGDYELAPNSILTVTRDGEKLVGQATGQGKVELQTMSETQFAAPAFGLAISFERDAAGKVMGLTLNQGGRTIKAAKIK